MLGRDWESLSDHVTRSWECLVRLGGFRADGSRVGLALRGEGEGVPTASLQNYPLRLLNAEAGKLMDVYFILFYFFCAKGKLFCCSQEKAFCSLLPRKQLSWLLKFLWICPSPSCCFPAFFLWAFSPSSFTQLLYVTFGEYQILF